MEGLQVGADDYIPKPFSLSVVMTKIQNMLRTRHRMLERYSKSLEVEPETVSYTHLDVYKRQGIDRANTILDQKDNVVINGESDQLVFNRLVAQTKCCLLYTSS